MRRRKGLKMPGRQCPSLAPSYFRQSSSSSTTRSVQHRLHLQQVPHASKHTEDLCRLPTQILTLLECLSCRTSRALQADIRIYTSKTKTPLTETYESPEPSAMNLARILSSDDPHSPRASAKLMIPLFSLPQNMGPGARTARLAS